MKKEMMNIVLVTLFTTLSLSLAACEEDDDDCVGDDCDSDTDDTDGGGDGDSDSDSDSDGDTDSDSDSDTDSDSETNDPTACNCLNGESEDEGCYDIEGDWYVVGFPQDDETLLTINLTIVGAECKVESTGGANFFYIHTGTMLPLELYSEEDDQHEQLYMEETDADTHVFHVKHWGQYANHDIGYMR